MIVSIAEAKQHCHVDDDDSDAVFIGLIDSVNAHLCSIGVDTTVDPLPADIKHAALLLIGHFFENREAEGSEPTYALRLGVDRLIAPYRSPFA